MRVEPMEDGSVRIVLSREDMEAQGLQSETLCGEKQAARRQLSRLLHACRSRLPFDPLSGRLYVEVFPYADGGCILFLRQTAKPSPGFDTPLIIALDGWDTLLALALRLHGRYHHVILQSALYRYRDYYLLLLYTYCRMEDTLLRVTGEYGELWGTGALWAAVAQEQGECVLESEALSRLTQGQ